MIHIAYGRFMTLRSLSVGDESLVAVIADILNAVYATCPGKAHSGDRPTSVPTSPPLLDLPLIPIR